MAVIGAGIGGLAAAWALRDRDVVVLEASGRVGGRIRTEPRDPYWLNLAAHLFPPPDSPLGRLVEELGLETEPVPGDSMGVALGGGRIGRLDEEVRSPALERAVAEYRALETPAERLAYRDDESFADFAGEVSPTLRAAIRRVSAEPEELSAGAGAAQFALTFSGPSSAIHRNVRGGSGRVPEALAAALSDRVVTGAEAVGVAADGDGVRIELRDGGERRARRAIVAVPAPVARRIVRGLPPDTDAALGGIAYGPYVCAALLTDEPGPMPWDDHYALVVPERSFNMLFNHASLLRVGPRRPGGSLMVYGSAELGRRLLGLPDEQVRELFLRDLEALFPEARGIVAEVVVARWPVGLWFSRPGRHRLQAALERPLGPIHLAGDYLGERGGMDVTVRSANAAAAAVREAVERA